MYSSPRSQSHSLRSNPNITSTGPHVGGPNSFSFTPHIQGASPGYNTQSPQHQPPGSTFPSSLPTSDTPHVQITGTINPGVNLTAQQLRYIATSMQATGTTNEALQIPPNGLPFGATPQPITTVPHQVFQATGMIPTTIIPQPDPKATLIGTVGGIPHRPVQIQGHHALSSVHVLVESESSILRVRQNEIFSPYSDTTSTTLPIDNTTANALNSQMFGTVEGEPVPMYIPHVRQHFAPFDPIATKIITPGNERQELFILARQAESAERFDDMAVITRQLAIISRGNLSKEERLLFMVAHKRIILPLRQALRCFKQAYLSPLQLQLSDKYFEHVFYELTTLCKSLIEFILSIILKATLISAENHVLFLKLVGDCYRYIAEINPNGDYESCRLCRSYYHDAALLAERYLSITSPIRLGLLLNYSVASFELFRDYKTACEMVKCAFVKAVSRMNELSLEDYHDSTLLLQLMRDNLVLWVSIYQYNKRAKAERESQQPSGMSDSASITNSLAHTDMSGADSPTLEAAHDFDLVGSKDDDAIEGIPALIFPTAYEIQSICSQAFKYPIELPINNGNSYLIPRIPYGQGDYDEEDDDENTGDNMR